VSRSVTKLNPQASITYQVGDSGFPVRAIKPVAMSGANPPNTVTDRL
jgi:hypothetical protein